MSDYNQIFTSTEDGMAYALELPALPTPKECRSLAITRIDTDGKVILSLNGHPSVAKSVQLLLDKVVLNLLTTYGENFYSTQMGSLITSLQRQASSLDLIDLEAQVLLALSSLQATLVSEQNSQSLSSEQKLKELKLSGIYKDPTDPTNILIEILVITESNEEYILTV
jgi:hypothetical protein